MKTKTILFLAIVALLGAGAALFFWQQGGPSSASAASSDQQLYTCGMHPQVIQKGPGLCPICHMKLTPIRKASAQAASGPRKIKYYKSTMNPAEISDHPGKDSMGMEMVPVYQDQPSRPDQITIDPVTVQNMGLRTSAVTRGPLRRVIRTVGMIEADETTLTEVTTKFKGWIEKLYVDATGQQVHRGEPLFEIYSPELYSAQMEYLLALKSPGNTNDARTLSTSAALKLKYFDISDDQIAELQKSGEVKKTLRVHAPRDGFVIDKAVVQGQMVDAGKMLYRVADLSLVWVQSQVYEQDLPYLKLGQEAAVTLSYLPDARFRGRVTYIYPTIDEKTRTARVRMEFHNPGYFLKPGMFATVELRAELDPSALLVPDSAVVRSGEKQTVFVALDGGHFEPRNVTLGPRGENDRYQVLSGLQEDERVVTSGQFLLDSESQLREAIQKMLEPAPLQSAREDLAPGHAPPQTLPEVAGGDEAVYYVCPMPEHVTILHKAPGKCPICGMTLVPVTADRLAQLQPGGKVEYYTCPMPEHSDVHEAKPGKCPRCGMTLIPVMRPPSLGDGEPRNVEREGVGGASDHAPRATNAPRPTTQSPPVSTTLYTCPMKQHAHVVSDKPGKCPECNMDLVPTSTVAHGKIAEAHWRKEAGGR